MNYPRDLCRHRFSGAGLGAAWHGVAQECNEVTVRSDEVEAAAHGTVETSSSFKATGLDDVG